MMTARRLRSPSAFGFRPSVFGFAALKVRAGDFAQSILTRGKLRITQHSMPTVSVVYFSAGGHTAAMAEAVAAGARGVAGTTVNLLRIEGKDIHEGRFKNDALLATLTASDAIIFGTPTYMGSVSGQFKCFADATGGVWYQQQWLNKLAAGFTVSAGASGDKLSTLQYLFIFSQQHGMIWIGTGVLPYATGQINRYSFSSGAVGQANQEPATEKPDAEDKATGAHLGKRVAEAAAKLAAK
jgi:NAD(P)H dehydrogenase (quinone)